MVYNTRVVAPVFGLRRELDRLFVDAFRADAAWGATATWAPPVDVQENERELTLSLELAGVVPAEVEITADNGVLRIRGEKHGTRPEGDTATRFHLVERTYGSFTRSFQLPAGLDASKITAVYENGVLTVHVPKAAVPHPQRITITTAAPVSAPASGNGSDKKSA
jgi:HSP20 family protein